MNNQRSLLIPVIACLGIAAILHTFEIGVADEIEAVGGLTPAKAEILARTQRIMARPEVQAALNAVVEEHLKAGKFPDEAALQAAMLRAAPDITPDMLPRFGPMDPARLIRPGEQARLRQELQEHFAKSARGGSPSSFQTEINADLLRPEVQAVLQEAVLEQIRSGGKFNSEMLEEVVGETASDLPVGPLRRALLRFQEFAGLFGVGESEIRNVGMEDMPPVAEVLQQLTPEQRDALHGHEHLLTDHGALMDALPSLPEDTREAAQRFMSRSVGMALGEDDRRRSDMERLERKAREAKDRGYRERLDSYPTADNYLAMAMQREWHAPAGTLGASASGASLPSPAVFKLEDFGAHQLKRYLDKSIGEIRLKQIPRYAISPDSENYIFPATHGAIRVFSKSTFGGRLMVREMRVMERIVPPSALQPLTMAGHSARVLLILHKGDRWVTKVRAYDGRMTYSVAVTAKLEGAEQDRFVEFARQIVEGG